MNNKTFWIGFVIVFVVMQVIGYVVHEIMLAETYASLADSFRPREEMMSMMWMMTISGALTLLLFCYIYTKGRESGDVMEGVRYGTLIGLFINIPMTIDQHVIYVIPGNLAVTWFVTGMISFIIAGAIFAGIYKPST